MSYVNDVLGRLQHKFSHQAEFLQAVTEIFGSLNVLFEREPRYQKYNILERIVIPERNVSFRVTWVSCRVQLGDWSLQRRLAIPPQCERGDYQILRI